MRESFEERIAGAHDLLDVLLILKDKTMLDTHVATLAYLEENVHPFDGNYGIWRCSPFPLDQGQESYSIQAYYFSSEGDSYLPKKKTLIVFTDLNFISSLETVDYAPRQTTDPLTHSIKYGVLVGLPGLDLSAEEKEEILDI